MKNNLLLGAEAVACGAIDAGISGVYAYPGTPSTEITEYIQNSPQGKNKEIRATWATNEKTAMEAALGMSYAGKRSIVCMKHVGLNVAADAFVNSAVTGINGGLVVVVADDPSMHSSQNEQDSRAIAKFALLPTVEPSTQQEAYDAVRYALDFSEKVQLPVVLRLVTRLSHSRSVINRVEKRDYNPLSPEKDMKKWILLPAIARRRYQSLIEKQKDLVEASENSPFIKILNSKSRKGIIATGIAYNYVMEIISTYNLDLNVLKISQYPLPRKQITEFFKSNDEILVAEEGYPVYEELLRGYFDNNRIKGRLDNTLPRTGELNPDIIATALGIKSNRNEDTYQGIVNRPPALCKGCGHRDMYKALNAALEKYPDHRVFGDIGCYTLGALSPFNAINTCVDMGASLTMAKGAAEAGMHPAVAIIGDSTFTHSGMTGLLDAVNDNVRMTLIISDNSTTAMTGGQDSAGTNKLVKICEGLGVESGHIRRMPLIPKYHESNVAILSEEFEYNGVSVILAQRECVQTATRKAKEAARRRDNEKK